MRKRFLAALLAVMLAAAAAPALALDLEAGRINPFAENTLTVTADAPGLLTIRVAGYMDAVRDLPVGAGRTEIPWPALSWHGEPITPGLVRLTAELTLADGSVRTVERRVRVRQPRCAVLFCQPQQPAYAIGGAMFRADIGISAPGSVTVELLPAGGAAPVWVWSGRIASPDEEFTVNWNWQRPRGELLPGEYVLRARSALCPDVVTEAPVTLTAEAEPDGLFLTGPVLPEDPDDAAAVWAAITAPAVVADGYEFNTVRLRAERSDRSETVGIVGCRTVALTVLDLSDPEWALVGAWVQGGGEYVEGWVRRSRLTVVRPSAVYGVVVDKRTQELIVYADGRRIGSATVSTGLQAGGEHRAHSETRAGAYLTGSRWTSFTTGGVVYQYPIRIDGPNLIHKIGWYTRAGIPDGLAAQQAQLGTKASHGCVRVDCSPGEGGINAYWLWTHLARNTKVLVIDDPEARHRRLDELGIGY